MTAPQSPQPSWHQAPDGSWHPIMPPPPPSSQKASTAGQVLAVLFVGFVLFLILALAAVTFLGSNAKPTSRVTPSSRIE